MQVLIKEETFAGKILDKITLEINQEILTVGELIAFKVEDAVARHNKQVETEQQGFIHENEAQLNSKLHTHNFVNRQKVDKEQEVYKAWQAFKENQMLVMVDNHQVTDLEEEIVMNEYTDLSFIRLPHMVGG